MLGQSAMTVPLHKVICPLALLLSACPHLLVERCLGSLDLRTVPSQATHLAWAGVGETSSLTARFSANHLLLMAVLGYDLSVFHALGTFCKHVLIWWITRKSCMFPACREAVKAVASASGQQRWWCCGLKSVITRQSADRWSPGTVSFACSAASAGKAEHCAVGHAVLSAQPRASLLAFSRFCHQAAAQGLVLLVSFKQERKGLGGCGFSPFFLDFRVALHNAAVQERLICSDEGTKCKLSWSHHPSHQPSSFWGLAFWLCIAGGGQYSPSWLKMVGKGEERGRRAWGQQGGFILPGTSFPSLWDYTHTYLTFQKRAQAPGSSDTGSPCACAGEVE